MRSARAQLLELCAQKREAGRVTTGTRRVVREVGDRRGDEVHSRCAVCAQLLEQGGFATDG
eukprot:366549-Chlamydomonas_euryale.AAC.4